MLLITWTNYQLEENDVHWWVIMFVFALCLEFMVVQSVKAIVKYYLVITYNNSLVKYLRRI
jgi:hypothetical protein